MSRCTPLELIVALNDLVECDEVQPAEWLTDGEAGSYHALIERVLEIADTALITPDGRPDGDAMRRLRAAGYNVGPGEQDSFGWLTGVIRTPKGRICYG